MKPDRLEQTLASYARDPLPAASEPSTTDGISNIRGYLADGWQTLVF